MTRPRYMQLADLVRADILSGRRMPGTSLATEKELCETHSVSRHTAREALRLLSQEGLIERRRGAGTQVAARLPAPAYSQPIDDFGSILQYAREAVLHVSALEPAPEGEAASTGLAPGPAMKMTGVRTIENEAPVALTRIYVLKSLAPDLQTANRLHGSITEWIEREHGLPILTVRQCIESIALDSADAEVLGVEPGTPALRTQRQYSDDGQRIVLVSVSLHPAGRFTYEMTLKRT